ncbi:F-box/LRR-repeat protein 6 [Eupeodes corollae]|uniref:F-box/LRR-repeat protein 6 n=1 Tax=Eupeodes corollae TaxID=290404 RepID=UPI002491D716|nr:F-box/LRR-repeat protein 6 [Eupeodes corollae]XP_055921160.1 F-box/LRR-repeat protein 6 [Eupeodes corollae]XP_055921161.1 F-box/LRR-repeat protein 6 [Eupeodes corollae]
MDFSEDKNEAASMQADTENENNRKNSDSCAELNMASVSPKDAIENKRETRSKASSDSKESGSNFSNNFETTNQMKEEKVNCSPNTNSKQSQGPETIDNVSQESTLPENILSPPKSETQTDETNTATSSPASESQLSPTTNVGGESSTGGGLAVGTTPATATSAQSGESSGVSPASGSGDLSPRVVQPINIIANGTIPKTGKPLMLPTNKKTSKPKSSKQKKSKALVAIYESEISDNKIGIKLCIKKSDSGSTPTKTKPNRKRSRKSKTRVDSDDSEYETKRRRERPTNNNSDRPKRGDSTNFKEPVEQSAWGSTIPENVLLKIFHNVVEKEGALPTLFRLGRVCALWRNVSLSSSLWRSMDLSTWVKEKHRTELKLKWFIENRGRGCTDLNVSNWKVTDISCILAKLSESCPNLTGITLNGWKGFTSDHLTFLVDNIPKLERLDLSSINVEMNASKSAVGLQSLCNSLQTINGRLTHLHLAHNRLAGIPQILTILASHCPNLVLLDLSNVRTAAISHGILHVEKLQHGCQKLKVLRVTNSHVTLSQASIQEAMDSPGFPDLEELSVAALTDESRLISDEHLQRILKSSSKLKLLDVRGCTRLTHESLIRLPAWDIKHLFLSGCSVTRDVGSGLELIASKWAHSLVEIDLAWANVQQPLDNALRALAEKGSESPLSHLNLCGSSVSEDAVKEILANCPNMNSINLSSCRGLPRGVKRLMHGPTEIQELREVLKVQMKVKLPAELSQRQVKTDGAVAN